MTRIALISAVPVAIPPTEAAFHEWMPAATLWNILDDRLLQDADEAGGLTEALTERMRRLITHALSAKVDAVLLTCSLYSPVAQAMALTTQVPVLAPDDAAFEAAIHGHFASIALIATSAAPLADSLDRFTRATTTAGITPTITAVLAADAAAPARTGDVDAVATAISDAVRRSGTLPDAILLGQYSIAPAAERLSELLGRPVIAGPQRAVQNLTEHLSGRSQ